MPKTLHCPKCGMDVSADTAQRDFEGICPKCLFKFLVEAPAAPEEPVSPIAETRVIEGRVEAPPLVGKEFGNYKILGMLGSGGMGVVYKARQKGLERHVALKVLSAGAYATTEDIERFLREARSAAKLQHPNIVPIHEVASHEGRYFFTMDLIEGKTLAEILREPAFTPRQALEIVKKVTLAVHYAHEHGIIHRDLKPQNILVDGAGEPKVMDFGLAKDISSDAGLTKSGTAMGTPSYMAPEQAGGEIDKIDRQTDVYALGAVLYECLTGRPPFVGRSPAEILTHVLHDEPVRPQTLNRAVQRDIETICLKALEKDKKRRYASAAAMAEDIERYLNGQTIHARAAGVAYRIRKILARNKALSSLAAAACSAILTLAAYFYTRPGYLTIDTSPSGAEVRLDGRSIGTAPLRGFRCGGGRHRIELKLSGYDDGLQEIDVGRGSAAEYRFPLYAQTEILNANSIPAGARVRVMPEDGSAPIEGTTPFLKSLPRGRYQVSIAETGYVATSRELIVQGGNVLRNLSVTLEKDTGLVSLQTQQEGVEAIFDSLDDPASSRKITLPQQKPVELASGKYRLSLQKGNGITQKRDILVVRGKTIVQGCYVPDRTLWKYKIDDHPMTPPLLVDLNGDGVPDVLVCEYAVHAIDGLTGRRLWTYPTNGPNEGRDLYVGVAVADVFGDERPEIFVRSVNAITALTSEGRVIWSHKHPGDPGVGTLSGPSIGDVIGDGRPYVVADTDEGILVLDARTGELKRRVEAQWARHDIALADLDGDGALDLLLTQDPDLIAYSIKRDKVLWKFQGDGRRLTACAIGNLSDSGIANVVVASESGSVYVLDGGSGKVVRKIDLKEKIEEAPSLADLDGDGVPEIVVGTVDGSLFVISGSRGEVLWTFKAGRGISAPAIGDVGGDGRSNVVIADSEGRVHVLRGHDGMRLWEYRAEPGGDGSPSLADLDRDGCLDVVVASGDGHILAIRGGTGRNSWNFRADGPVLQVLAAQNKNAGGMGDTILAASGSLQAIDGRDARLIWTCAEKDVSQYFIRLSDVTGDGVPDLVLTTAMGDVVLVDGASGAPIRRNHIGRIQAISATGADLNSDGKLDFVVVDKDSVRAINGENLSTIWSVRLEESCDLAALVGDLDGDGISDVVVRRQLAGTKPGEERESLLVLRGRDGAKLWETAWARRVDCVRSVAHLAPERRPALVVWLDASLFVLRGIDGAVLWTRPAGELQPGVPPLLIDANGDGVPDILAALVHDRVKVFDGRDGRTLWRLGTKEYGRIEALSLVPHADRDSVPDISIASVFPHRIHLIAGATGKEIWKMELLRSAGESERPSALTAFPEGNATEPGILVGSFDWNLHLLRAKATTSETVWEANAGLNYRRTLNSKGEVSGVLLRSKPQADRVEAVSLAQPAAEMQKGFIEEAIEGFLKVIEKPPYPQHAALAMYWLARCYAYLRDDDKALEWIEKASAAGALEYIEKTTASRPDMRKQWLGLDAFERLKENPRYKAAMKVILDKSDK